MLNIIFDYKKYMRQAEQDGASGTCRKEPVKGNELFLYREGDMMNWPGLIGQTGGWEHIVEFR